MFEFFSQIIIRQYLKKKMETLVFLANLEIEFSANIPLKEKNQEAGESSPFLQFCAICLAILQLLNL